jgi:hypothetical protein
MEHTLPQPFNFAFDAGARVDSPAHAASVGRIHGEDPERNFLVRIGTVSYEKRRDMVSAYEFTFDSAWMSKTDSIVDTEESALANLRGKVPVDVFAQLAAKIGHMRDTFWHAVGEKVDNKRLQAATIYRREDNRLYLAAGYIYEDDLGFSPDQFRGGNLYREAIKRDQPLNSIDDAFRILEANGMRGLAVKLISENWR